METLLPRYKHWRLPEFSLPPHFFLSVWLPFFIYAWLNVSACLCIVSKEAFVCTYQPLPALSVSQDYTVCLGSLWPRALTLSFWLRDDEGKKGNKLSRENSFRSVSGPTFTDLGRDVLCVVCSTEIKKQPAVGATGKKSPFYFKALSFSDFLLVSFVAKEREKRKGRMEVSQDQQSARLPPALQPAGASPVDILHGGILSLGDYKQET